MERSIVCDNSDQKPSSLSLLAGISPANSPVDTPGDSGVLCLDSESDLTSSAALMTTSLAGAEELACDNTILTMTRSDIDNKNVAEYSVPEFISTPTYENLPDVVLKALESDHVCKNKMKTVDSDRQKVGEPKKSLSEDIVFRRRCKKKGAQGTQKKRVSFHEDILKNTKTDNIHIERGFISYNPSTSYCERFKSGNISQRLSWCASGDKYVKNKPADIGQQALSDIIGYYSDTDKSGIFEYLNDSPANKVQQSSDNATRKDSLEDEMSGKRGIYSCESNSSDSNLSCHSESSSCDSTSSNSNDMCKKKQKCEKAQKSSSCDCFEDRRRAFMRKTYFSEADIDQEEESKKSFYIDNSLPKSSGIVKSVLKKKRYISTNVVEENIQNEKKGLNILPRKNIFDSLKNFYKTFHFNFSPEKGLPEGMEDSATVVEAIPCEMKPHLLSKSLDSGFQIDDDDDDFVEINLNEPESQNQVIMKFADTPRMKSENNKISNISKEDSPRLKLTLDMKPKEETKITSMIVDTDPLPDMSKYIINGESIVYEHKGVSFCYMHDSFQNAFEIPQEMFVPISDKIENKLPKITVQPVISQLISPVRSTSDLSSPLTSPVREFSDRSLNAPKNLLKHLQDEIDSKTGIPKHLSSPKRQHVSRYENKVSASTSRRNEDINCNIVDVNSVSSSTIKGDENTEESIDVPPDPVFQRDINNKTALLNRYLKNVYQKKDTEAKIRNNKFFRKKLKLENKFPSLVYPMSKVSANFKELAVRVSRMIDKEVIENKRISVRLLTANEPSYFDSFEDNVALECSEKLRIQIFTQPSETLHRMLKVRSPYKTEDGAWRPLLAFITDYALYVAEVIPGRTEYNIVCRLPHNELDAIAIGPDSAYVRVIGLDGRVACSLVTGEPALSLRLVSSLEWAARTSPRPPARPPAAITLDATPLARALTTLRQSKVCSGEPGGAGGGDGAHRPPPCDGYLMYKSEPKKKWEASYFLLNNGMLTWGPHSPDSRGLPHKLSLSSVTGVRRHADPSQRPHCFELAAAGGARMLLAAPDDATASTWLQALLMHAAHCLNDSKTVKSMSRSSEGPPSAFTVLVTPTEVVSVRETLDIVFVCGAATYLHDLGARELLKDYVERTGKDVEILGCGAIKNLTSFKIPNNNDNWCVLEWSVCEARERDAGLSLVFSSGAELERFISSVEQAFSGLSSFPFPLTVVDGSQCPAAAAHARYDSAWAHMLPAH